MTAYPAINPRDVLQHKVERYAGCDECDGQGRVNYREFKGYSSIPGEYDVEAMWEECEEHPRCSNENCDDLVEPGALVLEKFNPTQHRWYYCDKACLDAAIDDDFPEQEHFEIRVAFALFDVTERQR